MAGRIIASAVINENPKMVYDILKGCEVVENDKFGAVNYLSRDEIQRIIASHDFVIDSEYGIRSLYGIVANNQIKYDDNWNEQMYLLELELSALSPYKDVSFWKYYIIRKRKTS